MLTEIKYDGITTEDLVVTTKAGERKTIAADTIVLAAGATPNDQLVKSIEGKVSEIYLVGDCAQPKRIVNAIDDGARLGREV